MTKKHVSLVAFWLVLVLVTFSLSACVSNDQTEDTQAKKETITLRLAHFFPATHPAEMVLVKGWADAVNDATDGQILIESYPGESLQKAADIYNAVVEGTADIGLSCFSYTPGRFPVLEAFELPGTVYLNSRAASHVAWEGIKTLNPEEIQDTHLLMVIATGPGDLFTKNPVHTLEDIQGMEIRATGVSSESIKILGGIPNGMPQSDTYDALQKGVVQGNLSPIEVLKGWNHAEVTSYITKTSFLYNTLFFITMNQEKWDALPADLQTTITEVTEKFHEETAAGLWDMQNAEALDYAVNEHHLEIIDLTDEEQARWIDKIQPIQDNYTKKLADLGIELDPLSLIHELADQYNELYK